MYYYKVTGTNSTNPTSATATPATGCSGTTTLTQNGGVLGTPGVWKWYTGSCGGTYLGDGSGPTGSFITTPTGTTQYWVRAEGCNTTSCATVTYTWGAAPANDEPCAATPVAVGASCSYTTYTTSCAGGSVGPPDRAARIIWGRCLVHGGGSGQRIPGLRRSGRSHHGRGHGHIFRDLRSAFPHRMRR